MSLFDEMKRMIAKELTVHAKEVVPEANFQNDLGADSLCLLSLIEAVEDRYDIHMNEDELETVDSVASFVSLVESKVK